ncbi:MAG: hypothetical protein L6Q76_24460 [Polyangiaceae bacterium]|nr:hypothetical protein [Polyangiaceae bacterium]
MRALTGTEWLRRLARRLRKLNVDVELGTSEAVDFLRLRGAEGYTMHGDGGATILFRDLEPTASVVLEEVTHVLQAVERRFEEDGVLIMTQRREIEVRECLIERRGRLGLPEEEDRVSRMQLEEYRKELQLRP